MQVKKKSKKIKEKNLNKIKHNNMQGITLIALVVTIIVLIILAGVSINLLFGQYGVVTKAKDAKQLQEQAQLNEQIALNEISEEMDRVIGMSTPTEIKTVAELKKAGTYMTEPTTLKDSNGNLIKVPKGFKIAEDSGINVTEGILIEDNDIIDGIGNNRGNQYVWIPVGEITKQDGTKTTITLGRYVFSDGTNHKDSNGNVLKKGTPILKQSAENYANETEIYIKEIDPTSKSNYAYKELATYRPGVGLLKNGENATALDLKGFIDSVKANGGYYIARYEASYGTDKKANSKVSTGTPATSSGSSYAPTKEGVLWNNITQLDAAVASRGLYTTINSDLINSYAWDTAIVYIQAFSGNTDYSRQTSKNTSGPANTGRTDDTKDEVCKINDMASNTLEWTTEYCTRSDSAGAHPCCGRGGHYGVTFTCTNERYNVDAYNCYDNKTFRYALYM